MSGEGNAALFKSRRELWRDCLMGEDDHSVINQLLPMVWDMAAYRTINEARRLAPDAEEGGVAIDGLLHNLLDGCFWDSQVMAVRKLVDTHPLVHAGRGTDKSVYSLGALLDDMKKHAHLFTRVNFFSADGMKYGEVATDETYLKVGDLNQLVDRLAGVNARNRAGSDCARVEIFDALIGRMEAACAKITLFATKYRAHASTPESRRSSGAEAMKLTRAQLGDAHECLCRIHQTLSQYLFGTQYFSYLGDTIADVLKYADRPLLTAATAGPVRAFWQQQQELGKSYTAWPMIDLIGEEN